MENYLHTIVELLLAILVISTIVLIIMDTQAILSRFVNLRDRKNAVIQEKDSEIQNLNNTVNSLNETIANLQSQLSQNNPQEILNFLDSEGV
jgi:cell shape-determining protein MreC